MKILKYCLWAVLLPLFIHAQALRAGNEVPAAFIADMAQYHPADKLLILDFWATWCTSCIHEFPREDSLQQAYGNQLQIVLVNEGGRDDSAGIARFYARWQANHGQPLNLPCLPNNTLCKKLFPHNLIPHYAWVFHNRVLATTGQEEVNGANIRKVLNGETVAWNLKQDSIAYDRHKPFFVHNQPSVISGPVSGLPIAKTVEYNQGLTTRICMTNTTLQELFMYALDTLLPDNRVLAGADINLAKTYCYELITPPVSRKTAHSMMLKFLQQHFGIRASVEKNTANCLVLSGTAKLPANAGAADSNLGDPASNTKYIHGERMQTLDDYCNSILPLPFVDETGLGIVTMDGLPGNMLDTAALAKAFSVYGLILKKGRRDMDMVIFKKLPKTTIK